MTDCKLCDKHQNKSEALLYKDSLWRIYHGPFESQLLGYVYLEPIRHVENWAEFNAEELGSMAHLISDIEKALKSILNIERLYSVSISEAVRHLHLHLIPRSTESKIRGVELIEQATQQKAKQISITENDFNRFVEKLKNTIENVGR